MNVICWQENISELPFLKANQKELYPTLWTYLWLTKSWYFLLQLLFSIFTTPLSDGLSGAPSTFELMTNYIIWGLETSVAIYGWHCNLHWDLGKTHLSWARYCWKKIIKTVPLSNQTKKFLPEKVRAIGVRNV